MGFVGTLEPFYCSSRQPMHKVNPIYHSYSISRYRPTPVDCRTNVVSIGCAPSKIWVEKVRNKTNPYIFV